MAINTTLFGALEDLDDDISGDDEVEESGVSEDITDAEDDVEGTEEVIDGASTDLETLEEIKDVLEDAAEEGEGIDETAAKVVEVAVESIYARLGIPASNILGSAESFSNVRSRKTATKMAAEAIKDTIVRGWEAVKKFFKDLWKKIKELYARYITGAGRLEAKARKVRKYIDSRGTEAKEKTIENKSYVEAFCDDSGKNILGDQLDATDKVLGLASSLSSSLTSVMKKDEPTAQDVGLLQKTFREHGFSDAGHGESAGASTGVLVGNQVLTFKVKDAGKSLMFDVSVENKGSKGKHDSISVEDKDALKKHCDKIAAIARKVADNAKKDKDEKEITKLLDTKIKDASKSEYKKEHGDDKGGMTDQAVYSFFRECVRAQGKMGVNTKKISLHGCNKALGYVSKAGSMYK